MSPASGLQYTGILLKLQLEKTASVPALSKSERQEIKAYVTLPGTITQNDPKPASPW